MYKDSMQYLSPNNLTKNTVDRCLVGGKIRDPI